MLNICSLFQKFFGFIKNINKKSYRTSAVIISGAVIVSVICLCANDFGGSGKNIVSAGEKGNISTEDETETDDTDANALLQNSLFGFTEDEESDNLKERLYFVASIIDENSQDNTNKAIATITPIGREHLGNVYSQGDKKSSVPETVQAGGNAEMSSTDSDIPVQQVEESVAQTTQPETVQAETQQPETQTETEIQPETQAEPQTEPETQVSYTAVDIDVSDSDYYWLIRIVEAEAGNQDDIGKILVANVVLNRVKSDMFPDSIKSVIFQNNGRTYQFEPVKNERIYDMNPTENTINCVDRALNGEDYSNGALYFTMKTSGKSWFNTSLTLLFVHGDHYFYTN